MIPKKPKGALRNLIAKLNRKLKQICTMGQICLHCSGLLICSSRIPHAIRCLLLLNFSLISGLYTLPQQWPHLLNTYYVLAKCFAHAVLYYLMGKVGILFPLFYKKGNYSLGKFSKLLKNTQLESGGAAFQRLLWASATGLCYSCSLHWPSLVPRA